MSVHAPSGTVSVAACQRLFRRYPLAVTEAGRGYRSMVLIDRVTGLGGFLVLARVHDEFFVIRSWDRRDQVNQAIRPQEPVSGAIHQMIAGSMPVPRDGALLGWVTDRQVTAILTVHSRPPETWDDAVRSPEIRVMPMTGSTEVLHWPPFTASPLDDGRLWTYVERGEIVDLGPLLTRSPGAAWWVPAPDRRGTRHGYIVVMGHLPADGYWLPAGVYLDHWTMREGLEAPPPGRLLTLPGVVDLARRFRQAS